jgi:hypothetical protein
MKMELDIEQLETMRQALQLAIDEGGAGVDVKMVNDLLWDIDCVISQYHKELDIL